MKIIHCDLCIRNAEEKDCEQLAAWWNDGSVMAHAGFPNGLGITEAEIQEKIANDSDSTKRRLIGEPQTLIGYELRISDFCNAKLIG